MVLLRSLSQASLLPYDLDPVFNLSFNQGSSYFWKGEKNLYTIWQHQESVKCTSTITEISSGVLAYSKCPSTMLIQHDK